MFHIVFLEKTLKNCAILNLQGCKKREQNIGLLLRFSQKWVSKG
jgi:hypothetical protein